MPEFVDPDAPPLPDFTAMAMQAEPEAVEEEEPDFDALIRTRSRSRSLQDSEEDISNMIVANAHVHPIAAPPPAPDKELVGPINDREVAALQKVRFALWSAPILSLMLCSYNSYCQYRG